jgi:uncharacterized protein (DUF486 family)
MTPQLVNVLRTSGLLLLSNAFMTAAWYGHLKFRGAPLWLAILGSWLIALPEYALQVPANRWGYSHPEAGLSAIELKILQECITLIVFLAFAWFWLGETPTWRQLSSFALILGAVSLAFWK